MPDAPDPPEAETLAQLEARLRREWLRVAPPAEVAAYQARVIRASEAATRTRPASTSPASTAPVPHAERAPQHARDMSPDQRAAWLKAHGVRC